MASYATIAIRIFKKLAKGGTDEARAWAAYERFAGGESAESIWKLIEVCSHRHWFFFHGKKNTPCGIANAKQTFGHAAICAFVNACYDAINPQASYTGTHDLDDLSYTREGLETFARHMVETAWCVCKDHQSIYDALVFDQARYDEHCGDWEYDSKYCW